jgi:hypothetical protein
LGLSGNTSNKKLRAKQKAFEEAIEELKEKIRTAPEKGNTDAVNHWNRNLRGIQQQLDNVNRRLSLASDTTQQLVSVTPSAELGPKQEPQSMTTHQLSQLSGPSLQFQFPTLQAPPAPALGLLGTILVGGVVLAAAG